MGSSAHSVSDVPAAAIRLTDVFFGFVSRLPHFKVVLNKKTKKSEKVPVPTPGKRRMLRDFTAMLESGEYSVRLIELVLGWYVVHWNGFDIRTVSGFWQRFPMLLEKFRREYHPYGDTELSSIVQGLWNRYLWECGSEELTDVIGRSMFACEMVLDAMEHAGLCREISVIRNVYGDTPEWVRGHFMEYPVAQALTVARVIRLVGGVLGKYGCCADLEALDISVERTCQSVLSR